MADETPMADEGEVCGGLLEGGLPGFAGLQLLLLGILTGADDELAVMGCGDGDLIGCSVFPREIDDESAPGAEAAE